MPYDEELADRLRELLAEEPDVTEQRMFGGLAFLVGGHLTVAASGQGGLLVRVDPAGAPGLIAKSKAWPMEMRGRPMKGWLRVDSADVRTRRQLQRWLDLGVAYVRTLPPKRKSASPRRRA